MVLKTTRMFNKGGSYSADESSVTKFSNTIIGLTDFVRLCCNASECDEHSSDIDVDLGEWTPKLVNWSLAN